MCTNHPEPIKTTHSPRRQKPPISWCAENTSVGQLKSASKSTTQKAASVPGNRPVWYAVMAPQFPPLLGLLTRYSKRFREKHGTGNANTMGRQFIHHPRSISSPQPRGCVYNDPICKLTPLLCLCYWKQVAGNKSQVRWQQQKWKSGGVGIPQEREETFELTAWKTCGSVMRWRSKDAEIMTLNALFLCQRNDGYNHASSHTDRGMENLWNCYKMKIKRCRYNDSQCVVPLSVEQWSITMQVLTQRQTGAKTRQSVKDCSRLSPLQQCLNIILNGT